jgi:tetratricopeptide (TPR) repeat protein
MGSADEWKTKGNAALKGGDEAGAIECYSKAIELDGTNHVYYSNRSAALLSAGKIEEALADGEKCIEVKPDWAKGYSRKGAAQHAAGNLGSAVETFDAGLKVEPGNASLLSAKSKAVAAKTRATAATRSGSSSGSGGGGGGMSQTAQLDAFSKLSPDELRRQARQVRSMPPSQVRAANPAFAGMSDAMIGNVAAQMEAMAANPDAMKAAAEQMKGMSPEQVREMQDMAKNVGVDKMAQLQQLQKDMAAGKGSKLDQAKAALGIVSGMSGAQLSSLIKMQRDMIRKNPNAMPSAMGMDPATMAAQMEKMADTPPEQLESLLGIAKKLEKPVVAAIGGYQKVDSVSGGHAKWICGAIALLLLYVVLSYVFVFIWWLFGWSKPAVAVPDLGLPAGLGEGAAEAAAAASAAAASTAAAAGVQDAHTVDGNADEFDAEF